MDTAKCLGPQVRSGLLPRGLALLLPLALAACSDDDGASPRDTSQTAEATFSHQFPVAQQSVLRLSGISGNVDVVTGTPFRVEGTRKVGSYSVEDAEANLDRLEVLVSDLADEIRVETRQPDHDFRTYAVDYRLTVPDGVELDLADVNGIVAISPRGGSATVAIVNGAIQGDLAVPADGILALSLVNGSIDLSIPAATSASLVASVVNGGIATEGLTMDVSVLTATRLECTLGAGEATIGLSAVNGWIVVRGS